MAATPDSHQLLTVLEPWLDAPHWWLGLSGGLDSCLLLQLLLDARELTTLPPLTAIHINHQLSTDSAAWQEHCRQLCDTHGIAFVARQVTVTVAGDGPESAARNARYAVFEEVVGAGELLLLAHHLDDQLETFFLRLMRGAGPRGLAGMPRHRSLGRGQLCRPLLDFDRATLESCARRRELSWVEDESNVDLSLDRNFLRHEVLPQVAQRWPGYRGSVAQSMTALAAAEIGLAGLEAATLAEATTHRRGEAVLCWSVLAALSQGELTRLLRRWLETEGFTAPGREQLSEFARQLLSAQPDSQPRLSGSGFSLCRYRDDIYLCIEAVQAPVGVDLSLAPGQPRQVPGLGEFEMRAVATDGVRLPAAGCWQLRLREGGERCRPAGRAHSQSLKKLLQESAIPPWQRNKLPLLYAEGEIVAVADLWICEGWQAEAGSGFALHWSRAGIATPD